MRGSKSGKRTTLNSTTASANHAQRNAIEITKTKKKHTIPTASGFTKTLHRIKKIYSRSERNSDPNQLRNRVLGYFW